MAFVRAQFECITIIVINKTKAPSVIVRVVHCQPIKVVLIV